eukprot:CAMPEP_0170486264 /NCGR_PEP_ID=MMETSP0208-20121228/5319_1 /TAXON_ID=197538 /ORGANISM="Strombidium inclinatum, Strain S3" /LENGTH=158 /DNA_ID=CAMNT_0010760145 /DNA_START=184 /DNA_END=660 /DNA_ORIENTATION=+
MLREAPLNLTSHDIVVGVEYENYAGWSPIGPTSSMRTEFTMIQDLKVTGTDSSITLSWEAPEVLVPRYYQVSSTCRNSGEIETSSRTFTLADLSADSLCKVSIEAVDENGPGKAFTCYAKVGNDPRMLNPPVAEYDGEELYVGWEIPCANSPVVHFEV